MELSTFGVRFGYLRWLKHLKDGEPPSLNAIGEAVGRHGVTVGEWRDKERFPNVRGLDAELSRYFGAPPAWIADGEGEPPQPELWKIWVKLRRVRHAAADEQDALKAAANERRKRG